MFQAADVQRLFGRHGAGGSSARSPSARRDRQDRYARTLRHVFITAASWTRVPLRDVQQAASHADPRTTMRYNARGSLDRHATYIVAARLAGAAR